MASPSDLLVCPHCRSPLVWAAEDAPLSCSACEREYPRVAGIPVLWLSPDEALSGFRAGLSSFIGQTDQLTRQLAVELVEHAASERARRRLSSLVEGLPKHRDCVVDLFTEAGIEPADEGNPWPVLVYFSLIHRDWSWAPEVDEVTPSIDAIVSTLPAGFQLGNTIVLGAGTARLAWDLALRLPGAEAVLALDINPLPFLVTQRLMRGQPVRLFEVPAHPVRSDRACLERRLVPPGPPPPGLQLVFADGLEPPVQRGAFDTVITPWFVDQVPPDLAMLPPLIAELLKDGGSWINYGPFVYDPQRTKAAHRYCGDEFVQIVKNHDFEITRCTYDTMPYMASPASTQGRIERVLTMHAFKRGDAARADQRLSEQPGDLPSWLTPAGATQPVPRFPGIDSAHAPHPVVTRVAQIVNGHRSVSELTQVLVEERLLTDDESAEAAVRASLKLLWQDAARARIEKG